MLKRHLIAAVFALLTATGGLGGNAQADPAGLVLASAGPHAATIAAFSEIAAGTTLDLAPDHEIEFVHYQACVRIRQTGGQLVIGPEKIESIEATAFAETSENCPRRIVAAEGEAAGVLFRAAPETYQPQQFPIRIVLAGPARTEGPLRLRLRDEGGDRFAGPLLPGATLIDADELGLEVANGYDLLIEDRNGRVLAATGLYIVPARAERPRLLVVSVDEEG